MSVDWTVKATFSSKTLEPWAAAVLAVPERRAGQLNARYLKTECEAECEHNDVLAVRVSSGMTQGKGS